MQPLHTQLSASVDALKVAEILSARGVPAERARRIGEIAIRMSDPPVWDAAVWEAAERIASLLEPLADERALREFPSRLRQLHLVTAMHAIRGFERVMDGSLKPTQIQQAYADYQTHREQVLARTVAKRLDFPKAAGEDR